MFVATPPEQWRLAAPPTLNAMLVGGSEAAAMLSRLFTAEQRPSLVFPTTIEPAHDPTLDGGGGHRRAQANGGGGGAQQRQQRGSDRGGPGSDAGRGAALQDIQVQVDSGATIGRRLAQDDAARGSKLPATENEVQEQPKP